MMALPRKLLVPIVLIGVSGVAAASSGEAVALLERMTAAMSQASYQGTFVYIHDDVVETLRITHVSDEKGVRERLYSLSGPHREIVRDRNGVRCVLEDSASGVEDKLAAGSYFPELPGSIMDGGSEGYRFELGGEARIAGHTARRVSVSPADQFRYGYDFWVEDQSGLMLQWVLFDAGRKPLAKLMFTDFAVGPAIKLEELESASSPGDFVEAGSLNQEEAVISRSSPRWQPARLPPGFRLASHSHKEGGGGVYEHMVYSDGLAAVSVYIEQYSVGFGVKPGMSRLGTNNAYSRKQGPLLITVIGEVPAITVKSIANEVASSVTGR